MNSIRESHHSNLYLVLDKVCKATDNLAEAVKDYKISLDNDASHINSASYSNANKLSELKYSTAHMLNCIELLEYYVPIDADELKDLIRKSKGTSYDFDNYSDVDYNSMTDSERDMFNHVVDNKVKDLMKLLDRFYSSSDEDDISDLDLISNITSEDKSFDSDDLLLYIGDLTGNDNAHDKSNYVYASRLIDRLIAFLSDPNSKKTESYSEYYRKLKQFVESHDSKFHNYV